MKNYFFIFFLLLTVNVFSQTTVSKQLSDFSTLKTYSGIDVELIKSPEQKIVITGDMAENVKIKNVQQTLRISFPFFKTPSKSKVKVTIYYNKEIKVIDANEGSSITAQNFEQTTVTIKTQEGAYINMTIAVKNLTVKAVSEGIIKLTGTSKNSSIEASTGGAFHGFELKNSNVCKVSAGLGGKAEVYSLETLEAKVSFGGSIFYKGTPEDLKTKKVLGGSIEPKN
ncbi:hypothetical protein GCM10011416_08040 [Polaribacter pacificus]|uniref:Putative auto-transporter adhesin head GIN domain-containing protein n=1 Tax=Polaribacter pacificus TaxID=1775173 RepID=A0A917MCY5_9FLAO|nr:head GIN domain-containing protein [Polaribacter pacificus]GGG93328.1 hypothetical protein GCM10011416_08040 [Polaribacter pacificus]